MFYYIDQLRTPSFPIALVKTQSDFIVRTVETGSGRWTLVAAVISADAYPFLGFLRPDLSPCGYRNKCFLVALCRLVVRRTDMDREASPSACKNIRVVLVPCHAWKCVPKAISSGVDISDVPGCHVLRQMSSQWGSQKLLQRLVSYELAVHLSVFNLFFMAILWEGCKPGNFESNNSLKLSFTIFEAFVRILLNVNLSLNQTLLTFLLYVRQTWTAQFILAISLWGFIFL